MTKSEHNIIYEDLLKKRIIFLDGEITDTLAHIIISKLLYLDSISNEDIKIIINSPGGSVTSGLAIYDIINYIKSDVQTIGVGSIASMASIILISGTKGKRKLFPNAELMLHELYAGIDGKYDDLVIAAKQVEKSHKKLSDIILKNSNMSNAEVEQNIKNDYWLDPEEALSKGLIDEIIA